MEKELLNGIRKRPEIRYYFRYALSGKEFFEVRDQGKLLGRASAKPLYDRVTPEGRVDRSSGYSGRIAVIYVPSRARSPERALLLFTEADPQSLVMPDGRRNRGVIMQKARQAILDLLRQPASVDRLTRRVPPISRACAGA
jgi:hypothetical protein